MNILIFVLLLVLVAQWYRHSLSVDDGHLHVETTVEQTTAAVAVSGGGINGTARPEGLQMTVSIGMPTAIAS